MTETKKEETWDERIDRQNNMFQKHSIPEFHRFMKEHDIKYFAVNFNGGGDSGDFEDVYFVTKDEIPDPKVIHKEAGVPKGIHLYDMTNVNNKKLHNKVHALEDYYRDPMRLGHKYIYYKPYES